MRTLFELGVSCIVTAVSAQTFQMIIKLKAWIKKHALLSMMLSQQGPKASTYTNDCMPETLNNSADAVFLFALCITSIVSTLAISMPTPH